MNGSVDQLRNIAEAAGDGLNQLREMHIAAERQALGTLAGLGVPFAVETALDGGFDKPFGVATAAHDIEFIKPGLDHQLSTACSRPGDRSSDSIRQDAE